MTRVISTGKVGAKHPEEPPPPLPRGGDLPAPHGCQPGGQPPQRVRGPVQPRLRGVDARRAHRRPLRARQDNAQVVLGKAGVSNMRGRFELSCFIVLRKRHV